MSNGDALVVERYTKDKYKGTYEVRVKHVASHDINNCSSQKVINGEVILQIDDAGNYEAIAVQEHDNIIEINLFTDDNRAPLEATTWLKFHWEYENL